jgi:recombination associated protein RdgC
MWFKNLVIYRLHDWSVSASELEDKLNRRPLLPCGNFDMQSRGWVQPAHEARLLYTQNQQHLLALGVEQKLLPASVINQTTKDRAKQIAEEQGFPVGRRQMRELKERVAEELRARAFCRRRVTHAWIDTVNQRMLVNAAGTNRAEELLETLRETLGTLPATLLETNKPPTVAMAAWLMLGDAPGHFTIDEDLELQSPQENKAIVRYVRHPLEGKDIQSHISAGKHATRLGLTWSDRIALLLNDELQIKRLQFLDILKEATAEASESADEQFAIDFALMTGELAKLVTELIVELGGEKEERESAQLVA